MVKVKENLLNYARNNLLVLTVTARYMAVVFGWLYKGGPLGIYEFLEQRKMLKQFQKHELEKIKDKTNPAKMDVTCLYKLLSYTCDIQPEHLKWHTSVKAGQKPSLGQILYRLKDMRNSVSHPEPEKLTHVSDEDLNDLAVELQQLMAEMLHLAGRACGKPDKVIDEEVSNMKADVMRERHAESGITVEQFVTSGRQELLKRKEEFSYVEPRLIVQDSEASCSVTPLSGLLSSTFRDGTQPQVMQVTGEAGAGKTSLCRALMAWWLKDDPKPKALSDYQLLLCVTCARVNSRDLKRYLDWMLPKTTKLCDIDRVTRLLREAKVLWLVDGWDEATREARGLLQDLLHSRGKFHTVLATCRPEFSASLTDQFLGQRIFHVSFAGFQKDEMKELVRKLELPGVDNSSLEKFFKYLHSFPDEEQDDFSNPLKLELMALLCLRHGFGESLSQPSLVHIYLYMMKYQRLNLILRCKEGAAPGENVEQRIDAWLERLYKVSFDSAKSDPSLILARKYVKILSRECGIPVDLCISTFLVSAQLSNVLPSHSMHSFSHDTQRCVLAARHLECCCKDAVNPEAKLRKVVEVDSSELDDHIDPCLGVYDLLIQLLLVVRILLSRISCGFICSEVRQTSLYEAVVLLARKFVHIIKGDHLPADKWIQASSLRSRLVSVLLQAMEMWARDLFHVNVSASFLADLFTNLLEGDEDPGRWLEVVRRCGMKEELTRAVSLKIDYRQWVICDCDLRAAAMLLQYVTPEKVTVKVSDCKWLPHLHELLSKLAESSVELELSIQSHLSDFNSKDDSDCYLKEICRPQAKCSLTTFSGHLSAAGLDRLLAAAKSLTSLNLRVTQPSAVHKLTEVTQKLKKLTTLLLIYDNKKFVVPDSSVDGSRGILSPLSRKLMVHLVLPHLRETSVNASVDFISRFSNLYLTLMVGKLDQRGMKNLVAGLKSKAVRVGNFEISVYVKEYRREFFVNLGSLPIQTSVGDFLTKVHDLSKDPLRNISFVRVE